MDQHKYFHHLFDKKIFKDKRIFEIKPDKKLNLSFVIETNPEILKKECIKMGTMVKNIFGSRKPIIEIQND